MKFGKDLALNTIERWAEHYIEYKQMKEILKKGPSEETKVLPLLEDRQNP